jgi:hypothetical protein
LWDRYPEAGAYGTAYLIKKDSKARVALFSNDIPREPWEGLLPSYFKAAALGASPISASTVAIPRCILEEMNGFTTEEWMGEDVDLWGRIALKYPIAFSWDGKGIYHTEASNRACNKVQPLAEAIFVRIAKEALDAGEVPHAMQEDLREYIDRRQINRAWSNILAKRPDLARTLLDKCVTNKLLKDKYWALFWTYAPLCVYELSCATRRILVDAMYRVREFFEQCSRIEDTYQNRMKSS